VSKKTKTYTAAPEVPEHLQKRYATMLAVQSGAMTVSDGARELGMSRNHFQSMLHRGLQGLLEGLSPKAPGRPPTPEAEAKLRQENERLRRENEKLKAQVANTHQMVELVADVFNRRIAQATTSPRQTRSKKTTAEKTHDDPEDEIRAVGQLRHSGLRAVLAAAVVGKSASTLRRWCARRRQCLPIREARGPRCNPNLSAEIIHKVGARVRELHGLIGADSLRHVVEGLSRRQAAAIKRDTLIAMERERIADCERVRIERAGLVRGMDAMYQMTSEGWRWLLLFGDASVPYRTSGHVASAYDSAAVARAIDDDFTQNGAPLVLRMDRASAHRTDEVHDVLAHHHVLLLHGPPRHPGFYGQQERQNRDNRAWLDALGTPSAADLTSHVDRMRHALNELWPRRTLGFRTAAEVWSSRPKLDVDREALRLEVDNHQSRLRRQDVPADLAQRLAIEKALTQRGWLRREPGGWC
jgi:cell division septum initiation protein DivIVA